MSTNQRVYHQTRGFHLKLNQAIKAVENGAAVWIEYGKTIRSATIAESIAARNEQAKLAEPLAQAEVPGLIYKPAQANVASNRTETQLAREARLFFEKAMA